MQFVTFLLQRITFTITFPNTDKDNVNAHGLLTDRHTENRMDVFLFEQNISAEIAKLKWTRLPVFSAHGHFFCKGHIKMKYFQDK